MISYKSSNYYKIIVHMPRVRFMSTFTFSLTLARMRSEGLLSVGRSASLLPRFL